ncbi:MAG: hypothetical protein JXA97_01795 [Anaerolineales bacterium]|nr:hypothetical protein [Anaerolineales bacterium]
MPDISSLKDESVGFFYFFNAATYRNVTAPGPAPKIAVLSSQWERRISQENGRA